MIDLLDFVELTFQIKFCVWFVKYQVCFLLTLFVDMSDTDSEEDVVFFTDQKMATKSDSDFRTFILKIAPGIISFVIGDSGKTVKALEKMTNSEINIDRETSTVKFVFNGESMNLKEWEKWSNNAKELISSCAHRSITSISNGYKAFVVSHEYSPGNLWCLGTETLSKTQNFHVRTDCSVIYWKNNLENENRFDSEGIIYNAGGVVIACPTEHALSIIAKQFQTRIVTRSLFSSNDETHIPLSFQLGLQCVIGTEHGPVAVPDIFRGQRPLRFHTKFHPNFFDISNEKQMALSDVRRTIARKIINGISTKNALWVEIEHEKDPLWPACKASEKTWNAAWSEHVTFLSDSTCQLAIRCQLNDAKQSRHQHRAPSPTATLSSEKSNAELSLQDFASIPLYKKREDPESSKKKRRRRKNGNKQAMDIEIILRFGCRETGHTFSLAFPRNSSQFLLVVGSADWTFENMCNFSCFDFQQIFYTTLAVCRRISSALYKPDC